MLYTITISLVVLWLPGLLSGYTMGGLIHILLAAALITVLYKLTSGPRNVW